MIYNKLKSDCLFANKHHKTKLGWNKSFEITGQYCRPLFFQLSYGNIVQRIAHYNMYDRLKYDDFYTGRYCNRMEG